MNDPWDFRPAFDWQPMLIDPGNLERMFKMFRSAAAPDILNSPLRPLLEQKVRGNENELRRFVEKASQILARELCKRRIYCLTPVADSILMGRTMPATTAASASNSGRTIRCSRWQ